MKARFGAKVAPNSYELPRPPRTEGGEMSNGTGGVRAIMVTGNR